MRVDYVLMVLHAGFYQFLLIECNDSELKLTAIVIHEENRAWSGHSCQFVVLVVA